MSLMWLSCEVPEGFIVALERLIHFGKMSKEALNNSVFHVTEQA
jgi:hypothetical protein